MVRTGDESAIAEVGCRGEDGLLDLIEAIGILGDALVDEVQEENAEFMGNILVQCDNEFFFGLHVVLKEDRVIVQVDIVADELVKIHERRASCFLAITRLVDDQILHPFICLLDHVIGLEDKGRVEFESGSGRFKALPLVFNSLDLDEGIGSSVVLGKLALSYVSFHR